MSDGSVVSDSDVAGDSNAASDKIMFEIYRAASPDHEYRVVYYTELNDDNRDPEIDRAMAGDSVYDGFLAGPTVAHARIHIERWLARLNSGEGFDREAFEEDLGPRLT